MDVRDVGELIGLSTWDLLRLSSTCSLLKVEFGEERAELTDFVLGNWRLRSFIQGAKAAQLLMWRQQSSAHWRTWMPRRRWADLPSDSEEASIAHFDHVNPWLRQHGFR